MPRTTGTYTVTAVGDERVRAFTPHPLPPKRPALALDAKGEKALQAAMAALGRLEIAGTMVPSQDWFLYGFIRKEALVSSQIEGTQATLEDIVAFEATRTSLRPADVEEVCNYIDALAYARRELARPKGLPLCQRLLCATHRRLLKGARGAEKQPGTVRTSQNWIGGARPGKARFVPPPPAHVPGALADLGKWIHGSSPLPPLVKAGLAHAQFETIHPFLDGNGRVGRLLITLLLEHWQLLSAPLLYLSLAFKKHRPAYYRRLDAIRTRGDWEGWTRFFLDCVTEAADDAVQAARRLFNQVNADRRNVAAHKAATVPTVRLFDHLTRHPMLTSKTARKLLESTKPTTGKALDALVQAGVLEEITGKKRDRVFAYRAYLDILAEDT